jgi:hypothetical protein
MQPKLDPIEKNNWLAGPLNFHFQDRGPARPDHRSSFLKDTMQCSAWLEVNKYFSKNV